MHRLAIATIHHCSPPTTSPIYCVAPSKHPFPCKCPANVTHEINFTFCASISLPLCLPTYPSTYTNLTAPVPVEGAIHETVMELLFVRLLWVIAICRWWSLRSYSVQLQVYTYIFITASYVIIHWETLLDGIDVWIIV